MGNGFEQTVGSDCDGLDSYMEGFRWVGKRAGKLCGESSIR